MKKSKKLSLQSLALVLMSFILVAGVAFGMTGAWFSDYDSAESNTITMGKGVYVQIADFTLNRTRTTGTEGAMPGDTYTIDNGVEIKNDDTLGTEAMYLFVKVDVTSTLAEDITINAALPADYQVVETPEEGETAKWYYIAVDAKEANQVLDTLWEATDGTDATVVTLPTSLTNEAASTETEAKTLQIKVTVVGLQQANVDVANVTEAYLDAYAAETAEDSVAIPEGVKQA